MGVRGHASFANVISRIAVFVLGGGNGTNGKDGEPGAPRTALGFGRVLFNGTATSGCGRDPGPCRFRASAPRRQVLADGARAVPGASDLPQERRHVDVVV